MRALLLRALIGVAAVAVAGTLAPAASGRSLRVKEVRFDALNVVRDRAGRFGARAIRDFAAACPVPKDAVQWKASCERDSGATGERPLRAQPRSSGPRRSAEAAASGGP